MYLFERVGMTQDSPYISNGFESATANHCEAKSKESFAQDSLADEKYGRNRKQS
jgi:hypothetical protein